MAGNEYLSLTFLALASLGAVFVTPYFVEGIFIIMVVLITLWKKIHGGILTKLGIQDYTTTIIISASVLFGIFYLFKGGIFPVLGLLYFVSAIIGFKIHLESIYNSSLR